jgi:hypothetical protein
MSAHKTGNKAFDDAANSAEALRQVQVAAASTQAAALSAEVAYYRTLRSLAITSNISPSNFLYALKSLAGVQN